MPIDQAFLDQLFDAEQPVASSKLLALSTLADDEASAFRAVWQEALARSRIHLLDRLISLAEDNAEADFDAIFRIGLDDPESDVRRKAIDALWECQERWLLNRLVAMAEGDASNEVRATAAGALGRFVLLGTLDELRSSLVEEVETTLRCIVDNKAEPVAVRRRALEALAPSADPSVNDVIRDAYYSDEDELKISAVFAMGQHCDEGWLPVLLAELRNSDEAMRFEAARACGEMEDDRAVPGLIQLTKEPDPEIQEAAIEALGRIGGQDARAALRSCLKQKDQRVREAAQAALEEIAANENPLGSG